LLSRNTERENAMTKTFCFPACGTVPAPYDPIAPEVYGSIPESILAGSPNATVRVRGRNFRSGMTAYLDGVAMPTAFISSSELTFQATHADETTAHAETIEVRDGTTVIPSAVKFQYTVPPAPTLTCPVAPASIGIGTAPLQVLVQGTNFTATCQVLLDGVAVPTTYVSPTSLRGTVDPTLETAGAAAIAVRDTATGQTSATTCPFTFV
jgi:hypothetical protein